MTPKTERFEMRLDQAMLDRIDAWRSRQGDVPSRAEAIRRLIKGGLEEPNPKEFRPGDSRKTHDVDVIRNHEKSERQRREDHQPDSGGDLRGPLLGAGLGTNRHHAQSCRPQGRRASRRRHARYVVVHRGGLSGNSVRPTRSAWWRRLVHLGNTRNSSGSMATTKASTWVSGCSSSERWDASKVSAGGISIRTIRQSSAIAP